MTSVIETELKHNAMKKGQDKISQLLNSRVLIVGFANTGLAAAKFLTKRGCHVTISDRRQMTEFDRDLLEIENMDIQWEFGGHQEATFLDKDWILVSPGVPMDIPPLTKARTKGIPILSDIELAFSLAHCPILAITGTNGKTTTTTLLGEILNAGGIHTFVGGNIGTPILNAFDQKREYDFIVAEISSFQLEGTRDFAPHIAIILNITPDHLDRYRNMQAYKEAKAKILNNQTHQDYAILNACDSWVVDLADQCPAQVYLFSHEKMVSKGAYISDGYMIICDEQGEVNLGVIKEMGLTGSHNLENMMAASLAAYLVGVSDQSIQKTLRQFRGLPHRLEKVKMVGGVHFINDSKGTNVGAMIRALESIDAPIILIAGGQDKGGDFTMLSHLVREKVKAIFLIGEAKEKINQELGPFTEIFFSEDLRSAVENAYKIAKSGDTVLLSPGCASFDMFKDYKDRGEQFKHMVMELEKGA